MAWLWWDRRPSAIFATPIKLELERCKNKDWLIEIMWYTNLPICEKNELERWPLRVLQSSLQRKLSTDHKGWILQLSEYLVWTIQIINGCRFHNSYWPATLSFPNQGWRKWEQRTHTKLQLFNQIINHLALSLHTGQRRQKQKRKVTWRKNHLPGLGKPNTRFCRALIQFCHTEVLRTLIS